MSRDVFLYLEDMLMAAQKVQRYVAGMGYDEFRQDERTYDAIIRNLEVIGEAARNVSPEFRQRLPEIEWRSISAFRNILTHEYFAVRDEIVWDIIVNKVPALHELIQVALSSRESDYEE